VKFNNGGFPIFVGGYLLLTGIIEILTGPLSVKEYIFLWSKFLFQKKLLKLRKDVAKFIM